MVELLLEITNWYRIGTKVTRHIGSKKTFRSVENYIYRLSIELYLSNISVCTFCGVRLSLGPFLPERQKPIWLRMRRIVLLECKTIF